MVPLNFKHINAEEQIFDGSITSPLFAQGAVTVQAMDINGDLTFHDYQALDFRVENVTSSTIPAPGNIGRVVYNTTTGQFLIDNGTAFVPITATAGVSTLNTLVGAVTLAAGSNITITPSGNTLTIASTGSGSGITALTGDATATGPGSAALTLATVNSNVGSYTNANITVNAKGLITAASNGSNNPSYQQDLFPWIGSNVFTLTFAPISNSQIVLFNGLGLVSGSSYDYTLIGTTLTLNAGIILKAGDQILVVYAH
jgi:hypothetical protein